MNLRLKENPVPASLYFYLQFWVKNKLLINFCYDFSEFFSSKALIHTNNLILHFSTFNILASQLNFCVLRFIIKCLFSLFIFKNNYTSSSSSRAQSSSSVSSGFCSGRTMSYYYKPMSAKISISICNYSQEGEL